MLNKEIAKILKRARNKENLYLLGFIDYYDFSLNVIPSEIACNIKNFLIEKYHFDCIMGYYYKINDN